MPKAKTTIDIDARLDSCLQQESEKRIYHIWEHVKQQTEIFEVIYLEIRNKCLSNPERLSLIFILIVFYSFIALIIYTKLHIKFTNFLIKIIRI